MWQGRRSGTFASFAGACLAAPVTTNEGAHIHRFSDPDGLLELSPEQKDAGVLWCRPTEVLVNAKILSRDLCPEDIVQRIVADCSLCASIIICLLHCRTHDSEVCPTITRIYTLC